MVQAATGIAGGTLQLLVIPVLTAYLLYDYRGLNRCLFWYIPPRYQRPARELLGDLDTAVGGFLRAQLLIAFTLGVLSGVGLAILRFPAALSLGFLTGVGDLIPFFGPILTAIPAVLSAGTKGWLLALATAALLFGIQQLDANLLSPCPLATTTRLHHVTVIAAILFGAGLFGLWGAILAVPLAALMRLIYADHYKQSAWYRRTGTDDGARAHHHGRDVNGEPGARATTRAHLQTALRPRADLQQPGAVLGPGAGGHRRPRQTGGPRTADARDRTVGCEGADLHQAHRHERVAARGAGRHTGYRSAVPARRALAQAARRDGGLLHV